MTTAGLSSRRTLVGFLSRRRTLRAGLVQLLYVGCGIVLGLLVPTLDTFATIPSFEATRPSPAVQPRAAHRANMAAGCRVDAS